MTQLSFMKLNLSQNHLYLYSERTETFTNNEGISCNIIRWKVENLKKFILVFYNVTSFIDRKIYGDVPLPRRFSTILTLLISIKLLKGYKGW